jgi:fumarate hydratase class II
LIGNDIVVGIAGSQVDFELKDIRSILIKSVLGSSQLAGDACDKLRRFRIDGLKLDEQRISKYVNNSLMLVIALYPIIEYDITISIARNAFKENMTLREVIISTDYISQEYYDRTINVSKMVGDTDNELKDIIDKQIRYSWTCLIFMLSDIHPFVL